MPWGAPVSFNPFGEDPEEEKKRLQQQAEPGLMDVALAQAQNAPQSPVPEPAPYDPFQALQPGPVDPWRAAQKQRGKGILGDGFGILDPKQQLEDLDARFARLDRGQKQIANLEKMLGAAQSPYQRRAIEAQLNVVRSSLPDIDQLHRMEAGDAPLVTKSGLRAAVENAPRAFGESVLSIPEFVGIVKGYLGPGKVDDDSLVKWSLGAKESLRQMLPGDEARTGDFGQQLASGLGQIASFYGAGAVAALLKAGPKAAAAVVAAMGSAATGSAGFEEGTAELKAARDRAQQTGDTATVGELDRLLKFVGYSAIGVTEAIPVARTFSRAVPNPVSSLGHRLVQTGEGAIEEALQESGSQLAQNLVTQQTTNPNRPTTEGVAEGGAVGGVLGGLMNALMPGKFTPPQRPAATTPGGAQMAPGSPGGPGVPVVAGQPFVDRGTITSVPPDAPAPAASSGVGQDGRQSQGPQTQATPAAPASGQSAASTMGEPTVSVEAPRQIQAPRPPVIDVDAEPVPPLARARGVRKQSFTEDDLNNGAIGVDAQLMQFKEGGDKEGVTDRLKGVKAWDPVRAGNTIVYEYADGRRIVADGHQRLGLAKRLASEGKQVDFDAFIFREADGYTPQQVRQIAAIKNIAEGSGTSLDAAKVLRELGTSLDDLNLPPNSALARDAAGLSKLGDDAFGMVVNEVVPKQYAAIVGQEVADPTLQTNIMGLLARLKPSSALEARAIVSQARQATVESTQENLFGAETTLESLYGERAKVLAEAARQLRANKRVFQTLLSNEKEAEKAGNVLNRSENERQARVSAILGDIIDRLAYATGPISSALTTAARDFKSSGKLARAGKQFADAVTDSLARGEIDGLRIGGVRSPAEGETAQGEEEVDLFGGTTDRVNLQTVRPTTPPVPTEMQESEGSFGTGDMLSALREAPRPQTEAPEFKNWFGDSKVVDAEGKPLVVWHGTNKNFDTFDMTKGGSVWGASDTENVMWFSSQKGRAEAAASDAISFSGDEDGEAVIMPVYLSIQNPLRVPNPTGITSAAADIERARQGGHDGLIITPGEFGGSDYVIFKPNQIKSATKNRGTFDPNDDSILHALREAPRRDIDNLGYYSKALEEAKALKQERGSGAQMLGMLRNAGVKEAEIQTTGLDLFLADKPSVTKTEIVDHLRRRRVRLQESRYGGIDRTELPRELRKRLEEEEVADLMGEGGSTDAAYDVWLDEDEGKWTYGLYGESNGEYYDSEEDAKYYLRSELEEAVSRMSDSQLAERHLGEEDESEAQALKGPANYSDHALEEENPTNRESVFHLPLPAKRDDVKPDPDIVAKYQAEWDEITAKMAPLDAALWAPGGLPRPEEGASEAEIAAHHAETRRMMDEYGALKDRREALHERAVDETIAARKRDNPYYDTQYKSGHWDEMNPVAHARTSVFKDTQGRRAFLIDELQSDWGQKVRKKGPLDPDKIARLEKAWAEATSKQIDLSVEAKALINANAELLLPKLGEAKPNGELGGYIAPGGNPNAEAMWEGRHLVRGVYQTPYHLGPMTGTITYWPETFDWRGNPLGKPLYVISSENGDIQNAQYESMDAAVESLRQRVLSLPTSRVLDIISARSLNSGNMPLAKQFYDLAEQHKAATSEAHLKQAELNTAKTAAPAHPLINSTDQWVETAMRRLIRQAIDAGADGISITPGKVVAERFNKGLRDVHGLAYDPNTRVLYKRSSGSTPESGWQRAGTEIAPDELDEWIGDEMAEKLLASPRGTLMQAGKPMRGEWHSLSFPTGMELGGEGMRATYDGIYPRTLGKLLQKFDKSIKPERTYLLPSDYNPNARMSLEELRQGTPFAEQFIYFPLTEKAKEAVKDEGQPLFALAGSRAQTADQSSKKFAENMEAKGRDPRYIFRSTGWLRGPDLGWRFEIDDSAAKIKNLAKALERPSKSLIGRLFGAAPVKIGSDAKAVNNIPLTDILHHPKLFQAYPFLRKMRVDLLYGRGLGQSGALRTREQPGKTVYLPIRVTAESERDVLSVLLHEIQHYIQNHEGFAQGSDVPKGHPAWKGPGKGILGRGTKPPLYDPSQRGERVGYALGKSLLERTEAENIAESLLDLYEMEKSADPEARRDARSMIRDYEANLERAMRAAPDTYDKSFGEYEARLVQDRMDMTAEQRREAYPLEGMPEGLQASRTQTRDYQQAYDEIMRRAMVNLAIKKRWAERRPVGAGIAVIRPMEDHLAYFKDDGKDPAGMSPTERGHLRDKGNMATAKLYPEIAGATPRFSAAFYDLPYAEQKPIADAISRDIRSRNMRPTIEGYQSEKAFEFWKRYDPAQIIADPRLYRAELDAAIKKEYGPEAELVLYGDINPDTGHPYGDNGNVNEPWDVYAKVPGAGAKQDDAEAELARLTKRYQEIDGNWKGLPEQRAELNAIENRMEELREGTYADFSDIVQVPRAVLGDIIPVFESAWSKAADGVDKDVWMVAQRDEAMRERGLKGDNALFALSDAAGKTKLAVVHNLSAENLAFSDAMGGLAVPSLAVLKEGPRMGIGGFGEITLIGREELADPTKNPVFDADAWSVRFPKPDYPKVPRSLAQPLLNQLHKFEKLTDDYMAASNIWDYMVNDPNPADLMRAAVRSTAVQSMFLATKGIAVEPVMETRQFDTRDLRVDRRATEARISEQMKGLEPEFQNWINATFIAAFGRPTMKLRGRKVDYTLENIVDAMTPRKKVNAQEDFATFSEGKARAMAAKRFRSMTAMRKAAATQILSESEVSYAREVAQSLMETYRMAVVPFYSGRNYRGEVDTWDALDASMRAAAAVAQGSMTSNGLAAALRREGFVDVPQDVIDQGMLGINAFMAAPVPYFESKPQRAVRLHEFAGAVIPESASEETKAILAKHRIPFRTYKNGFTKEGRELFRERETADYIKELASDGFSTLFALKELYSPAIRAVQEMKDTPSATPERWWSLLGKTPGKKEELDLMGVKVWLDEQKGRKIPKEELVSFMQAHQLALTEIIKGDNAANEAALDKKAREIHDRMVQERLDNALDSDSAIGDLDYSVEELEDGSWSYTLDGEPSLDAFDSEEEAEEAAQQAKTEAEDSLREDYERNLAEDISNDVSWHEAEQEAKSELRLEPGWGGHAIGSGADYRELLIRYPKIEGEYKSKHFQDHEIVYTRFDSRFGEDGQKTLFIQEIQSDLHQHAKDMGGYRKGTIQDAYDVWNEELARAARLAYEWRSRRREQEYRLHTEAKSSRVTINGSVDYDPARVAEHEAAVERMHEAEAEFDAAYEDIQSLAQAFADETGMDVSVARALLMAPDIPTVERYWTSHRMPDAPFKDNEWWKLALKRMIGYAVEHGFDTVALPTAEQVNESVGMPVDAARTYYEKNIPNWLRKYLKPWGVELRREKISGIETESFWGVKPDVTAERTIAHGEKALAYQNQIIAERMKRDRERLEQQGASAENMPVPAHLAVRRNAIKDTLDRLKASGNYGDQLTAAEIQAIIADRGTESEFNYSYITTAKGDIVQGFLDERGLKHLTEDYGQGAEASLGVMRSDEREAEQIVFDIPDKMREDVREKGQPLFAGNANAARDFINGRVRMGHAVNIPPVIGKSVFREIADVKAALPDSDFTAVLSRIEPATGRNVPEDGVRIIFTEEDGTEHAYDGLLDDVYASRALYIRESSRGRGVLFLRTQPVGLGDPTIRGELRHEAVHALRKHGRLTGATWGALVNHANHLRVLGLSISEYLSTIGAPVNRDAPDDRTLHEVYTLNYKKMADFAEVMDQEAVAHLLELYNHIPDLFKNAPEIKAIADAIFRGDFSGPAGGQSRAVEERIKELAENLAAMGGKTAEGQPLKSDPAFKAWFGDSKVVDEDGKPMVVYHGTMGDFGAFDKGRANVRSDLGAGFYFTNTPEDVAGNYGNPKGPDIEGRINYEIERIAHEEDLELSWNTDYQPGAEIYERARAKLGQSHEGATLPVYLKIEDPFVIDGEDDTKLESSEGGFLDPEDEDSWTEPTGPLVDFLVAFRNNIEAAIGDHGAAQLDELMDNLRPAIHEDGGISAKDLIYALKEAIDLSVYVLDYGDGETDYGEIIRQTIQDMGYDGIIDHSVSERFGPRRKFGTSMPGVKSDTTHYIVFEPTQIKSAFNRGTFDRNDPNILHAFAGMNAETADHGLLNHAIEMEMEGVSADDIWKQTGWTRGLEDEWRFEIDDSKAELKMPDPEWLQKAIKDNGEFELQQLLDHPKLYQAYPFLKELRVRFSNHVPFEAAEYVPGNVFEETSGKIVMGLAAGEKMVDGKRTKYPAYSGFRPEIEMMKSVLMHEIQHAIQQHENFAWGSDPGSEQRAFEVRLLGDALTKQDMAVIKARGLIPQLEMIFELMGMVKAGELSDEVLKETLKAEKGLASKMGIALYGRNAGEIEARLVQARVNKPRVFRQIKRPKFDEFPREQVRAVRFGAMLNGDWRSSYTQYLKETQAKGEKPVSPAEFKKEFEAESV